MTSITSYLALIRDKVTQKSKDCVNLNTFGHLSFLHSFCICFFPLHHFIASLSHSVLLPIRGGAVRGVKSPPQSYSLPQPLNQGRGAKSNGTPALHCIILSLCNAAQLFHNKQRVWEATRDARCDVAPLHLNLLLHPGTKVQSGML